VLRDDWDPSTDVRLTVWEMVHHLVRALDRGEAAAADLVAQLGSKADTARERAYRLYTLCERKTASLAIESQATGNLKPWR
jgi:putative DNA methylase